MTTVEIIAPEGAKIGSTFYPCGRLVTADDELADAAVSRGVAVYAAYTTFKPRKGKKATK